MLGLKLNHVSKRGPWGQWDNSLSPGRAIKKLVQSTPVILRQLGAKIRERELSGSPVISREGPNSRLPGSESHTVTSAPLKPKQYVER